MDDRPSEQLPEPLEEERQHADDPRPSRPPAKWKDLAEEAIEKAIRSGTFDDLPGRGKPLKLINNPYAPGTELAYQLLQDNQYTLPWISERVSLLARIDALRDEIGREWTGYQAEYCGLNDEADRLALTRYWQELLTLWEGQIIALNKEIATLNLKQPGILLEIMKLSLTAELTRAGADGPSE